MFIFPVGEKNPSESLYSVLCSECRDRCFYLLEVSVSDWNRQLSPWPASSPHDFAGCGLQFLYLIKDRILIDVLNSGDYSDIKDFAIIGYSLAGLFSLWALYNSDIFSAAASCSGSLWYDGFTDYMASHSVRSRSCVYLSLGAKEEKTKNPVFSTIGNKTQIAADILRNDPNITSSTYVLNPGGHHTDVEKRISSAVKWCLDNFHN